MQTYGQLVNQVNCQNLFTITLYDKPPVNRERTLSSYRHFETLEQQSKVPTALVNLLLDVLSLKHSTHGALAPVDPIIDNKNLH